MHSILVGLAGVGEALTLPSPEGRGVIGGFLSFADWERRVVLGVVHFLTHPEVVIDPGVAVTAWGLSGVGLARMRVAVDRAWLAGVGSVFCSAERKAVEAAAVLGERLGVAPVVEAGLGENDRSSTGYLPKAAFEAMADRFFAEPTVSVRGWERAVDAQARICAAVDRVLAGAPAGDVAIVAHGGVGALLLCALKRVPISRAEDQPGAGGGWVFSFDRESRVLRSGWRPIEA